MKCHMSHVVRKPIFGVVRLVKMNTSLFSLIRAISFFFGELIAYRNLMQIAKTLQTEQSDLSFH